MLWADVSWSERFGGLGSFHRLLVTVLTLAPGLIWRGPKGDGIAAHDDIFQSSVAAICGFGVLGCPAINMLKRHWQAALMFIAVAAVFLAIFCSSQHLVALFLVLFRS